MSSVGQLRREAIVLIRSVKALGYSAVGALQRWNYNIKH